MPDSELLLEVRAESDSTILEVTESECIECRLRVEYQGWDWFSIVTVSRHYNETELKSIPKIIEEGIIQSKKISKIVLEARVISGDAPCNCEATVDGKLSHVVKVPEWKEWSINWSTIILAISAVAVPAISDLKKIGLGLTGPFGLSALLHSVVLNSIEVKIRENSHPTKTESVKLDCEWTDVTTVFDLGRVPTTQACMAELFHEGKRIKKIILHFD